MSLAATQDPLCEADQHELEQPGRSLRIPTDLAPSKKRVDVLLVGSACAPAGEPQQVLRCRLAIGNIDKAMLVHADRYFDQDGQLCFGAAFDKLPLSYELASGGEGSNNPVGIDPESSDQYGRTAVPNLTPADAHIVSLSDRVVPIGFGPLAPSWRRDQLPASAASWSDTSWSDTSWSETPLPEGFERSYFNCAPLDQQLDSLEGDEHIILEYLHPEHAGLHSQLPGIEVSASVDRGDGQLSTERMRCDTLLIDTDRGTCSLSYKLDIALSGPCDQGRVTISATGAGLEAISTPEEASPAPAADAELPAHLAGLAGDVRETVSFDGFGTSDQPASTPFEATQMPRPATGTQPRHGLPFKRVDEPAPPAAPAPAASPWAGTATAPASAVTAAAVVSPPGSTAAVRPPSPLETSSQTTGAQPDAEKPVAAVAPAPRRTAAAQLYQLVWFDEEQVPRVRRHTDWADIIEQLHEEPSDDELDEAMGDEEPADVEDRREIFEVIRRATPTDPALLRETLSHAVREGGKLAPPLVLMTGELRFSFDELKQLEATIAVCTPFATGDEVLEAALNDGNAFLQTPNLLSGPGVSEALTKRITQAFERVRRLVPADYLAEQTQRALLNGRHYQVRELFGASQIRASFHAEHAADSKKGIPLYLLADLAMDLPLFADFPARVIVELCLREDQYEAHPACLRLVALARAVPRPSW